MFKTKRLRTGISLLAVVLGAVGTMAIATAGPAAADGAVTWKNAATGNCLRSDPVSAGGPHNLYTAGCTNVIGQAYPSTAWYDVWTSDGTWLEQSANIQASPIACLDSNSQFDNGHYGAAYALDCNGGRNQHWYELSTTTGWALEDQATGLFLDGGNGPNANHQFPNNVFANSNYGNGDSYQRWH